MRGSALLSALIPHEIRKLMVNAQHLIGHGWLENSKLKGAGVILA